MSWAFLRLIGIRGALAIVFALSTLTFYAMWKYEVGRKNKILAGYAKAQVEADVKRRLLEQELAEAQKKRPPVAPKIKEVIRENPSTALFLLLCMTGCHERSTKQMPPASALIKCPLIPQFTGDSQDAHSQWEAEMIDIYTQCAQRHDVLRKWHK